MTAIAASSLGIASATPAQADPLIDPFCVFIDGHGVFPSFYLCTPG